MSLKKISITLIVCITLSCCINLISALIYNNKDLAIIRICFVEVDDVGKIKRNIISPTIIYVQDGIYVRQVANKFNKYTLLSLNYLEEKASKGSKNEIIFRYIKDNNKDNKSTYNMFELFEKEITKEGYIIEKENHYYITYNEFIENIKDNLIRGYSFVDLNKKKKDKKGFLHKYVILHVFSI
ncbi:MAG TPA: hypothetical protein VIG40_04695 [Tissierellaceae bacterium]